MVSINNFQTKKKKIDVCFFIGIKPFMKELIPQKISVWNIS